MEALDDCGGINKIAIAEGTAQVRVELEQGEPLPPMHPEIKEKKKHINKNPKKICPYI